MFRLLVMMILGAVLSPVPSWAQPSANPKHPVILAHYMPWFEARPSEKFWGWHWTMNHFDPEQFVDGKRSIAAHLYPEIGPYDSGDVDVIEYHLLTMKLAGIDGVIIDWYGLQDFRDYALLHRNTMKLIAQCQRLGMQFAICYEDQTIPALVEGGKLRSDQRMPHAQRELQWLAEHWFVLPGYVRMNDKPMLFSFGSQGLSDEEWSQCFSRWRSPVTYLSLHFRRPVAAGVFDWPVPQEGLNAVDRFYRETPAEAAKVPVVFPRFQDIYQEAKLHDSYGRMDDADGKTFRDLLQRALSSRASVIQLATWNDWGEGTVIEPSREYGYRDLEHLQQQRRSRKELTHSFTPADLRLPRELFDRRKIATTTADVMRLNEIAAQLVTGKLTAARTALAKTKSPMKP